MSGPPQGGGIFTIFGILIGGLLEASEASRLRGVEKRARARAVKDARKAERASQAQRQRGLDEVRRQMARGDAGDATQEDARAALRGSGGRRSELDDRWF